MAKKFLDNTGLSHLINLIQGMPDDQTIGYTTETGLHVLDGSITPNKISSLQQLRYEMGLGNTLGALPIENGGTGLTSEAAIKEWLESLLDLSGGGGGQYPTYGGSWTLNAHIIRNPNDGKTYTLSPSDGTMSSWLYNSNVSYPTNRPCIVTYSIAGSVSHFGGIYGDNYTIYLYKTNSTTATSGTLIDSLSITDNTSSNETGSKSGTFELQNNEFILIRYKRDGDNNTQVKYDITLTN